MDVRTYRGAIVDLNHYSVIARIRASISNARYRTSQRPKKWDIAKLRLRPNPLQKRHKTQDAPQRKISDCSRELKNGGEDIEPPDFEEFEDTLGRIKNNSSVG
ncbi:unnamed protein product [Nezara viridula]|uniref:Uncharacterized protein n=1 Tax=Nezara viridula TaxID=85310 RepID=A0A9P0E8T4_NEZVI|nr:unnamed protein product [Nezara viridula]